jgi:uncharacterized CHY-type Zn-finger protein
MNERTSWKLSEWNEYFKPADSSLPPMAPEEIVQAVVWLTNNNYPVPEDCPALITRLDKPNVPCPAFRPSCLIFGICRAAKGMCESLPGMKIKCPTCAILFDPEKDLRDELSKREYRISGMCQSCQDKTFGR